MISSLLVDKAELKVVGTAANLLSGKKCTCLFNPSDFSINRGVSYAEHKIPGQDRPVIQFVNGEAETLTFSLLFDTYSAGAETKQLAMVLNSAKPTLLKDDVRKYTDPFFRLMDVNEDKHAPDEVDFIWGKIKFRGYVTSITQKFTLFSSVGIPLRATLDFTLKSSKKDNNIRNSPDRSKHRIYQEGDRLYALAQEEYGDCGEWRRIATANGVVNPRRIKSGSTIYIPPIL